MNLLIASERNQSWYYLQSELLRSCSSRFSQIGIAISDQFNVSVAYFSIEHKGVARKKLREGPNFATFNVT